MLYLFLVLHHIITSAPVGAPLPDDSPAKLLPEFITVNRSVYTIAFSPDATLLAVAGGDSGNKPGEYFAELTIWNLKDRKKVATFVGHKEWIDSLAFSPDGKTLATSTQNQVRLWDVVTGKEIAVLDDSHWLRFLTFSPDGKTLAGAIWPSEGLEEDRVKDQPSGTVLLWDVKERKVRAKLEGHAGVVSSLAYSPDGKTLATASSAWDKNAGQFRGWYKNGEIKLWDPEAGKIRNTVTGHKGGRINTLVFSPDGKILVTGCVVRSGETFQERRGEVSLWDVATGRVGMTKDVNKAGVTALAFSHDGKLLAVASEMQVKSLDDFTSEVALLDPQNPKNYNQIAGFGQSRNYRIQSHTAHTGDT